MIGGSGDDGFGARGGPCVEPVDELVPAVPGYLAVRDAAWRPGDSVEVDRWDGVCADGDGVGPGGWGEDEGPLLVVPDGGVAYRVVRDPRGGGWVPTVAGAEPGPELAALLGALAGEPFPGLAANPAAGGLAAVGDLELGEVAAACDRLASWARGLQAAAVGELSRRESMQPLPSGQRYASVSARSCTALEVTGPLRLTARQAERVVAESVELIEDFPATHTALLHGRLDERRARVILTELRGQQRHVARAVEAAVLGPAEHMTGTRLRRRIRDMLHHLAPVTTEERRLEAEQARHVSITPAQDGMAWLEALLPAEDAAALGAVLTAGQATLKRRDAAAGDPTARTTDQRRADTLARLAWTALATSHTSHGATGDGDAGDGGGGVRRRGDRCGILTLARAHHRPVTVNVTVALPTLLGLDDQPADLYGHGPIPAHIARHLAAAGLWRWVGTHPTGGAVIDHGRTRYTPTQDLIDHVILRDRTCRAPGCTAPAETCDLDHTQHYPHGHTAACNLGLLCRKHHLAKHHTQWRVDQPQPGTFRWTSPTGRTTTIHPTPPTPPRDPPPPDDEPPGDPPPEDEPPF